jgi:DNA-binding transcriptional ArsR family regulator
MKHQDVIAALAALAQDSRLAIYRLLVKRGPEGYAAGEISDLLRIAGPSLSFHLKELAHAGLVTARKDGRFIYYSAHFERMSSRGGYLAENGCSQGGVCARVCAPDNTIERKRKSA